MHKVIHALLIALVLLGLAACGNPPYTNIGNDELQGLLDKGIPIYDIRRPDEWRSTGVIKGSKRLTFVDGGGQLLPNFLPTFSKEVGKNDPVILICRTGNRTSVLAKYLAEELGYTNIYNVRNGITRWISERRPVTRR